MVVEKNLMEKEGCGWRVFGLVCGVTLREEQEEEGVNRERRGCKKEKKVCDGSVDGVLGKRWTTWVQWWLCRQMKKKQKQWWLWSRERGETEENERRIVRVGGCARLR